MSGTDGSIPPATGRFWSWLDGATRAALQSAGGLERCYRGDILLQQAAPIPDVYVLVEDRAALYAGRAEPVFYDLVAPGSPLVLSEALAGGVSPFQVRLLTDGQILKVPVPAFQALVAERNGLRAAVERQIRGDALHIQARFLDLRLRDTVERTVAFLWRLMQTAKEGEKRVVLPVSKSEIAEYLGMTPASFSRALSWAKNYGFEIDGVFVSLRPEKATRRMPLMPQLDDELSRAGLYGL